MGDLRRRTSQNLHPASTREMGSLAEPVSDGPTITKEADNMESSYPAPTTEVTVVEAEGCHFCADALRVVNELSGTYPLHVLRVRAHTEDGRRLLGAHRAALFPLVLLEGAFFSQGRLPRRKLEHELALRITRQTVG